METYLRDEGHSTMKRRRLYCYHCAKYTYHIPTPLSQPLKQAYPTGVFQCLRCGKTTTEEVQPKKRPRKKRETWAEKEARIAEYFAKKEASG